ncbi:MULTISPECIES: ATP-binding protein [Lachnospira]|jgi:DNA polymerase-3 subunit delta'|uniref:DNA polymerase III subunit delta' n=1 Tax=Lachnospira multipara TaxID=28051 RepID=A0A1H5WJ38_9FIRM|nr:MULTISPECIES: DNA polymerase III subunit delta' C-terminal domain-containing protein [Lachnospira]SEF99484.1 DNA polymerase-3 subunit delta' [Lachnospira multipara]
MSGFADIYGYDTIKEHLQNAVVMDKVSHAYVFSGNLGAGKKMLAKIFAKTLQCEEGGKEPCNHCHSCVQAESNNQPDIIWVRHEKPGSIGVDDIRDQLVADIQIKPYSSRYKIYIIDEAEKLTVQAQNALLKTIEEPPAYGIVILLSKNADIFLQTILSRCVVLDLKPLSDSLVENYIKDHISCGDYERKFAAKFARGCIGRAISILESDEFSQLKNQVVSMVKNAKDMTSVEIMDSVKKAGEFKLVIDDYLDLLNVWFRDVLIFKSTADTNLIIFSDEISSIRNQAELVSYEGLQDILDSIDKVKVRLQANVNFDLTMELLIMAIKENL